MAKDMIGFVAQILVIVGGLNWGLVGLFGLNLVDLIFGAIPVLTTVVYVLVGLSAVYMLYGMTKK